MKIFKKISLTTIIISMLMSAYPTNNAYAVDYQNISVFSPQNRATVEYKDGVQGLSYTSFNNFLNNPNIPGAFKNDERQFIVGKNCGQSATDCGSKPYYNTLEQGIKEGDTVRFAVYFHNNGGDPYVKETSVKSIQDATNVKIGVVFDKQDPNAQFAQDWLRPQGYIYADNNQYRTTITDANSVIKNQDGSELKTATDDMAIMLGEKGLYLEPVKDSAWLWNKNANFDKTVKVGDEMTFTADSNETPISPATKTNLAKTKVTAIDYSPTEMSITFDRLPGCFRYSGFVYFDVKVVKKPVEKSICTALKITKTDFTDPLLSPETASKISATPTFAPTNKAQDTTEILWSSTDKTGKFWKKAYTAAQSKYKYLDITGSGNPQYNQTTSLPDEEIYYTGYGEIKAELKNVDKTLIGEKCTAKFTLVKPQKCAELQVNYPLQATEGIISDFAAKAINEDKSQFSGQIKYWVDKPENGKFYTNPPAEYPYMNQPYNIAPFGSPEGGLQKKTKKTGQTGTQTTTINQQTWTHFVGLKAGEKIHVQAYDKTGKIDVTKCQQDFTISEAPQCKSIILNKDLVITEGQLSTFSAIGRDAKGKTYNGKITYSVPAEYGTFYTDPNDPAVKAAKANTSQKSKQYDDTNVGNLDLAKPIGGEFCENSTQKPKDLTPLIIKDPNLIPFAIDILIDSMYGKMSAKSMEQIMQQSGGSQFFIDPNTSDLVNPLYPTGQTTNPGQNNVFNALDAGKLTQANKIKASELNKKILKVKAGDPQQVGSTITVDPNTKVYFVPKKGSDGKKVISLYINCTSEGVCSKSFEIVPAPKEKPIVCEAAGVTATDLVTKKQVSCLKKGEYLVNAGFYSDKPQGKSVAKPSDTSVKWESTDPNGLFYDASPQAPKNQVGSKQKIASAHLTVKYIGEGKVTATLVAINGKPYTEKACSAFVVPCTKYCSSILFNYNSTTIPKNSSPLVIEEDMKFSLKLTTKDNQGDTLPEDTKFKWVWNTNGTVTDSKGNKNTKPGEFTTTAENLPLAFSGTDKAGQITVTIDPSSSITPAACKADLSILKPEEPLMCKEIKVVDNTTNQAPTLVPNQIYQIRATTEYSKIGTTDKNRFSVDSNVGTIINLDKNWWQQYLTLNALKTAGGLTKEIVEKSIQTLPFTDVPNEGSAFLVTYSNTKISVANALRVKAENFSTPASCDKTFPLIYTAPKEPPEQPKTTICEDLNIQTPNSPWIADGSKELFEIDVTTTPKNQASDLTYEWKVTKGEGTWNTSGNKTDTKKGSQKNTLKNAESGTTVEVYALDKDGKKVDQCSDTIKAKTLESPVMTKSVYVTATNPSSTTKDLLNVGSTSKNKNVTYSIQFKANSAKEVDIWESAMRNSGQILGDKDGNLSYLGMIVNVTEGSEKYTILKDGSYALETADSKFTDYKYSLKSLEDKHNCKDGTQNDEKVCIDDENFSTTVENFKDGEKIEFKNLRPATVIEIKVQMKNNTKINAESCKKLSKTQGCGEEFKNTAKFEATLSTEENEKGSATAKVIVICPYVLTRQAGDVFFHDVLDTGIDVSRCSEVKSTPGLVIQPEKIKKEKVTNTGTGTGEISEEAAFLEVPSHDICRYSNSDENIEGYDDILTNFSSTICEMRADVAETWKETYINKSIEANVERISRFGENLNVSSISAMQDLQTVSNAQSGVFVKQGDLTIGENGDLTIEANGKVPAGQTYIIKNGTLRISSNVKYGTTDYTDPNKIPSAAFIVIDGNIIIDNDVEQIDAIIMAIDTDGKDKDGRITNSKNFDENNTTDKLLIINGSLIGNVAELFSTRTGAGDPTKDEGSVTIRYDERILLNTPPGLSDLLNVTQSLIPG